jgi:hypothetical protein
MNRELRYRFHSRFVENWLAELVESHPKLSLVKILQDILERLYLRTQTAVSPVTLSAILERVLYNSSEQYPILASIQVIDDKADFSRLENAAKAFDRTQTREAIHYLLTEFLFIIGTLTGEQLTPFLHQELENYSKFTDSK